MSDRAIGALHNALQAIVNLVLGPEEALQILHPFKVADGYTASVGQNIGNNSNTSVIKDVISFGIGRAIGGLNNQARFNARGIPASQLILQSGWDQYITGKFKQFRVSHQLGIRQALQRAMLFGVAQGAMNINAVGVIDAAIEIAQTDNFAVEFVVKETGRNAANVAEALDHHRAVCGVYALILQRLACDHHHTTGSGFHTPFAAANANRLTGNHGGNRIAFMHRIRIHHPGHNLRVCIHIGRENIAIRAN